MPDETVTPLADMALPWGKELTVQDVVFEGGLKVLRLRFREGRRFTIVDLDAASAEALSKQLAGWIQSKG